MQIDKRSRAELKQYFVKNAIPTESNFAEFIDGMLNQKDDGIAKPAGSPLSLEAAGDATSQKKVLQLFNDFRDNDPAWVLSLNPRMNPADPATARTGFAIGDGAGNSRLFIDPSGNLEVSGEATVLTASNPVRFTPAWSGFPDTADNHAEISNDTNGYKTLMIVGNKSAGLGRRVSVWDRLEVNGVLQLVGTRMTNTSGLSILQGDANDWLRVNPDEQFPAIALYKPVAIGSGGLAVGYWDQLSSGQGGFAGNVGVGKGPGGDNLEVNGAAQVLVGSNPIRFTSAWSSFADTASNHAEISNDTNAYKTLMIVGNRSAGGVRRVSVWDRLEVNGVLQLLGSRMTNASGFGILQGDANDWLRINPDQSFPAIALYKPVAIGIGGLSVGTWQQLPAGQGLFTDNIGTHNYSPTGGGNYPTGWAGGVHTWDVVAEASVGYSALRQWSSIEAKSEIRSLDGALPMIEQLNPVVYLKAGSERLGFVAEEVREVSAHAAGDRAEDEFFASGIHPDALLALAIRAIQELSQQLKHAQPPRAVQAELEASFEPIQILREGSGTGKDYVTVRFSAAREGSDVCRVVRTFKIPPEVDRDALLQNEYQAWRAKRVPAGRSQ